MSVRDRRSRVRMDAGDARFRLRWVLACGAALGAGLALAVALAGPLQLLVGMMLVTPAMLALAGAVFGGGQWLTGRWGGAQGALRWVIATTLGISAGMTVGIVAVEVLGRAVTGEQIRLVSIGPLGLALSLALIGVATGSAMGLTQWLAARAGDLRRTWITRCGLGLGLGLPLAGLVGDLLLGGLSTAPGMVGFLALSGIGLGMATASAAARMAGSRDLTGPSRSFP